MLPESASRAKKRGLSKGSFSHSPASPEQDKNTKGCAPSSAIGILRDTAEKGCRFLQKDPLKPPLVLVLECLKRPESAVLDFGCLFSEPEEVCEITRILQIENSRIIARVREIGGISRKLRKIEGALRDRGRSRTIEERLRKIKERSTSFQEGPKKDRANCVFLNEPVLGNFFVALEFVEFLCGWLVRIESVSARVFCCFWFSKIWV